MMEKDDYSTDIKILRWLPSKVQLYRSNWATMDEWNAPPLLTTAALQGWSERKTMFRTSGKHLPSMPTTMP